MPVKSKSDWVSPRLDALDVAKTLGGTVPDFEECDSFTGNKGTVFGTIAGCS